MEGTEIDASLLEPSTYALEVTGKGIAEVEATRTLTPQGTPINIAVLGNESHDQRLKAARIIRNCGFEHVPIVLSRRLRSGEDRDSLLGGLRRSEPGRGAISSASLERLRGCGALDER